MERGADGRGTALNGAKKSENGCKGEQVKENTILQWSVC
jgi:hypothetical protein